ncbi:hypothetical protein PHYSODRAFT_333730 [Phytophthora sojae]|uniref:Uncharacterized protein n=1 Tax=Phytophthora sojae (strain P6497) TaxID=1094619 RepID=G4ZQG0_PHYSP|nr:hypothetical protein PHYSODRAFT_333730 [Phytophthora sojae]EGZ15488.1 hypothetical protein PHYSODRAFT_333730 [Phytophthora sojae]|eukprot:XP_009529237.1 hypothetical protein PHYSODRAFT_333730 [Phytophthora sojae]
MKRARAEGDADKAHRQYKHLKGAQLPAEIQAKPQIMKRIDEFAMSTEAAALQAAAANDIDWLRKLLPHLRHKMADVARAIIKTAATHGFWEVFNLVDTWWAPEDEEGKEEKFRTGCGDSLAKAIEGGHLAITRDLLEGYDCDYSAGLDLALKLGRDHAAAEIYQSVDDPYMVGHLRWAARHGSMRVLKDVYDACWEESLPEAMGIAASHGHFEIVKFLFEKCRHQLLEVENDRDVYKRPLACAIMHGQVEIAKYLYANGGYADYPLDELKVVVAARGPLELVELFHKDGRRSNMLLTFMNAAINGKIDAMEYL